MDSGSENDSAGDGRSANERRDRKNLRQIAKRRRAEKELRKREKALGGKREPRRLRRGRKKVAALTAPDQPGGLPGVLLPQGDGRAHLEVGFPLRCFQRLSDPHVANQQCPWQDNWYTRGTFIPVLSY